jgi:hypothetical protein
VALPVIEAGAGDRFEGVQPAGHRSAGQAAGRERSGGVEEALLGVQHRLAGVAAGGVLGEHRLAVLAAQLRRVIQQGGGLDRDRVAGGEGQRGHGIGQLAVAFGGH